MMDGITVQHSGELLFDTSATGRQRSACSGTYLRCLEDVTFALAFGDGFGVTQNLPQVGKETPGADLCAHFSKYVRRVVETSTSKADAVIADPSGREAVKEWLQGFKQLRGKDYPYWREFFLRESDAYLWPEAESARKRLVHPGVPVEQLEFGKDYWSDSRLLRLVDDELTDRLGDEILTQHSISQSAAREFIRRVVVAHAAIFEGRLRGMGFSAVPGPVLTYLPHVTRTTLFGEGEIRREIWRLGRLVMPRLLTQVLKDCDRRSDVLIRLEDLAADGHLEPLRIRLREAMVTQNLVEIEKIRSDIESKLYSDVARDPIDVVVTSESVRSGDGPEGDDGKSSYDAAINFVLRRTPDIRSEERAQAERIFPELKEARISGIFVHRSMRSAQAPNESSDRGRHVFISYLREDAELVTKLKTALEQAGINVWLDRQRISLGEHWEDSIRRAIGEGDFFIACFSESFNRRARTFMNEELLLAIDELRKRQTGRAWFLPVLLSPCEIPDLPIGAGKTLRSIQRVDLHESWDEGIAQILKTIMPEQEINV